MTVKIKYGEGGPEVIRDGMPVPIEEFLDDGEPPTMEERRLRVANLGGQVSEHASKVIAEREEAFNVFLRYGREGLSAEQRAQAVGTDSAGGYLTPASFADTFTMSLKTA